MGESSSTSSSPAQSTLPLTDQVVVHLRTIRAEDMPETENALLAKLGNKQDPYVLAKMGAYQTRTPTVSDGNTSRYLRTVVKHLADIKVMVVLFRLRMAAPPVCGSKGWSSPLSLWLTSYGLRLKWR